MRNSRLQRVRALKSATRDPDTLVGYNNNNNKPPLTVRQRVRLKQSRLLLLYTYIIVT